jgi:sucrose-6-phosphate hydrolase SacC (GH32 family)
MNTKTTTSKFTSSLARAVIAAALLIACVGVGAVSSNKAEALNPPDQSLRAQYHLTPPTHWLSDPQRPIYANGKYNLYYLYSNPNNSPGGWRHATTTDNVVFADQGIAIPLGGTNFPVWTGSGVVDTNNTAGFGAGSIVVLATQPTNGNAYQQEQYLWYSTDGGTTFTAYGAPVITNPGNSNWFRDPKIVWDSANNNWVAVIGRQQELSFYTSPDLKSWTHQSDMTYTTPNIGGFECPDIYQIKADDGTTHWVLGASTQGDYSGQPDTYAYWTGTWNGSYFATDTANPQWLDWGWDWYAAVSWPNAANPDTSRYAMGWMNNWHYAGRTIPTDVSDNYNGQMSVVREIHLAKQADNSYSLLSQPVAALDNIVTRTIQPANTTVSGTADLSYHGSAYQLDADVSWSQLNNVGISVGMSADKTRHTNIGIYQGNVYVDRSGSDQPAYTFGSYQQSQAPFGAATSVHLKVLVDRSSVEVYVDNGKTVLSNQVFFQPGDQGISLYTDGGSAIFANMTIKEFENVTTASVPATPYADFEGTTYGSWTTTGTAFGSGPVSGTLPNQQPVTGYIGNKLVNSYNSGDSTTGSLTSPSFTVNKTFINFLAGGGNHPRPSSLFADFEGTGWGSGWTATGSFNGQGPSAESLPNQVGSKVLDTFVNGGDGATGTISSSQFTITRDYVDFLIAGGNHPWGAAGATAVNLVVDGVVQRTATGTNSGTMTPVGWDVHSLIGHTAQIQVVDNATGAWGHLMADQILFTNAPGATVGEPDVQTTVNLLVGGNVVRTTTGQDSEHLAWSSWDVTDLIGQSAQIQIIDGNTSSWGHINADQFSFDDRPAN